MEFKKIGEEAEKKAIDVVASLVQRGPDNVFYFRKLQKQTSISIKERNLFFNDPRSKGVSLYKGVKILNSDVLVNRKKIALESYLLTGEAGCGKSILLESEYMKNRINILRWRAVIIFINSFSLNKYLTIKESQAELLNRIRSIRSSVVYMYVDGLDEIGDLKYREFSKFIQEVHDAVPKLILKISCRHEFAQKHLMHDDLIMGWISNTYHLPTWTPEQLKEYGRFLIKKIPSHIIDSKKKRLAIEQINNRVSDWKNYINSPLLMKQYIYILLYYENEPLNFSNKYYFYELFIHKLVKQYLIDNKKATSKKQIDSTFKEVANAVFKAFCEQRQYIPTNKHLVPILKKAEIESSSSNNPYSLFVHQTYFEFFVGYHYLLCIKESNIVDLLETIGHSYSNDYADFITAAIKGESDKEKIKDVFIQTYLYTLEKGTRQLYFNNHSSSNFHVDKKISSYLASIEGQKFFTIKYEILFRMGRLGIDYDDVKEFLIFVYKHDHNIRIKNDTKYFQAVLKRCCAISASLIGEFSIEMDYVRHMFGHDRIEEYDLANRSHTLIFYGDVNETDIFHFRDDFAEYKWDNARKKRIQRLSVELNSNIKQLNKDQLKKYRFRLFDLATIYTFLADRKEMLTKEEYNIVCNCNVNFDSDSTRNDLMNELKNRICNL